MAENTDTEIKSNAPLSSNDIGKIYYNDRSEFVRAMREKTQRLLIWFDTKLKINNLLTSIEKNNLKNNINWNIVWTTLEQEKFNQNLIRADISHDDAKVSEIIKSEFDREEIESYLRWISKFEREEISIKDEVYNPTREMWIIVRKKDLVSDSLDKMWDNKYNCVFLLDDDNKFLWIFTKHQLNEFSYSLRLEDVIEEKIDVSWNRKISNEKAGEIMSWLWINALPILDDNRNLYWVLSIKSLEKNEIKNTCMLSLTKLYLSRSNTIFG